VVGIAPITAEAEDAELVGLGQPQCRVEHEGIAQQHLGRRHVVVDAVGRLAADGVDDRRLVIVLVLDPGGDLRQEAVLVVDGVAEQLELRAEDVLVKGESRSEPELGAGRSGVELFARVGQLEPVKEARGRFLIVSREDGDSAVAFHVFTGRFQLAENSGAHVGEIPLIQVRQAHGGQQAEPVFAADLHNIDVDDSGYRDAQRA